MQALLKVFNLHKALPSHKKDFIKLDSETFRIRSHQTFMCSSIHQQCPTWYEGDCWIEGHAWGEGSFREIDHLNQTNTIYVLWDRPDHWPIGNMRTCVIVLNCRETLRWNNLWLKVLLWACFVTNILQKNILYICHTSAQITKIVIVLSAYVPWGEKKTHIYFCTRNKTKIHYRSQLAELECLWF